MSARDELAGVLAAHGRVEQFTKPSRRPGITVWGCRCPCGEELPWAMADRDAAHREHQADALLASPQFARLIAAAEARGAERALREAADAIGEGDGISRFIGMDSLPEAVRAEKRAQQWLRDRAALTAEPVASEPGAGEGVGG